ncbi:hypothetical protein SVIOM342S_09803 [Streptomyces violaceorubidus]
MPATRAPVSRTSPPARSPGAHRSAPSTVWFRWSTGPSASGASMRALSRYTLPVTSAPASRTVPPNRARVSRSTPSTRTACETSPGSTDSLRFSSRSRAP